MHDPWWMRAFLAVHITAGTGAFVLAPLALITAKGGKAHRLWGKIYFWCMTVVAFTALVMAAYLAGVTRAPVTSFIISMEMTASNQMLLPLMAATVVASQLSKLINPEPLYHKLSEKFVVPPERYRSAVNVRTGRDTDEESVVKYSTEIKKYPEDEGSKKVKE